MIGSRMSLISRSQHLPKMPQKRYSKMFLTLALPLNSLFPMWIICCCGKLGRTLTNRLLG